MSTKEVLEACEEPRSAAEIRKLLPHLTVKQVGYMTYNLTTRGQLVNLNPGKRQGLYVVVANSGNASHVAISTLPPQYDATELEKAWNAAVRSLP